MTSRKSELIVKLIDGVTGPAGRASRGLLGIPKAMRKANGQMMSFGDRMRVAIEANNAALDKARGRMMEAVAGAYVLRSAFNATAGAAMSLEEAMADVAKVSGMSDAELSAFEKTLRKMATSEIPMAVEELAALAAAASQSGIANEDLEEFTRMVAKTAVAWDMSGAAAGEALAKLKTALGLSIEETQAYGDAINFLSNTTATSEAELIEFARRVAADGKVAGFTKEEVLALGAAMISSGAEAEVAATSLRNAGRMLSRGDFGAKKSQRDAFKQLGIDAEKVAKAMQVDASGTLLTILEAISKADAHKQLALMSGIFGDEARALMPLLANLEKTKSAIEGVASETAYLGSVEQEFETRAKTARSALTKFKNQLHEIAIVIGKAILPILVDVLDILKPYIAAMAQWAEQNPKLVAGLFAVVSGLVALRIAMTALSFIALIGRGGLLGLIATGASLLAASVGGIAGLSRAFLMVAGAIKAVSIALLTNPIVLTVAAIAGSAYLIYRNWGPIKEWFGRLWDGVKSFFTGFTEFIAGIFTLDMSRAAAGISAMWAATKAVFKTIWDGIAANLRAVWENIIKPITDALGMTDAIVAAWNGLKSAFDSILSGIGAAFQAMWSYVEPIINGLKWVYDNADSLWSKIKGLATIGTAVSPGNVSGYGARIKSLATPSDPTGRANGGPITAGETYLVGEEGPELITPSKGGYVHQTGTGFGSGGGAQISQTLNVTVNAGNGDARSIAREVSEIIQRETRRLLDGVYADTGLRTAG